MKSFPDSKVHGANMGPIWGRQDPGGPHVGPMNFAIWVDTMRNRVDNIVYSELPTDSLAPLGVMTSAGTVMTKFGAL